MGFGGPQVPAKLQQEQQAEAQQAQEDRTSLLQNQLGMEDEMRSQIYGMRGAHGAQGQGGNGGGYYNGGGGGGGGGGFQSK